MIKCSQCSSSVPQSQSKIPHCRNVALPNSRRSDVVSLTGALHFYPYLEVAHRIVEQDWGKGKDLDLD